MKRVSFFKCNAGLIVLLAGAASSSAATMTYSVDAAATLLPATTLVAGGSSVTSSFTDTATLPKFNPALGTLTDVTFSYNYGGAIDVEGGGGAVGQINGEIFVNGTDTALSAGGGGFGPGGVSALNGSFTGTYDDPNLPNDAGTGTVSLAWVTTGNYVSYAYGTPTATLEATSPSPVSVTYTYTAVPEPTSLGLLFASGVSLLARRRRSA